MINIYIIYLFLFMYLCICLQEANECDVKMHVLLVMTTAMDIMKVWLMIYFYDDILMLCGLDKYKYYVSNTIIISKEQ